MPGVGHRIASRWTEEKRSYYSKLVAFLHKHNPSDKPLADVKDTKAK
jgi:hypothetical protein